MLWKRNRLCRVCGGMLWRRPGGWLACVECDRARDWVWYQLNVCRHTDEHGPCSTMQKGNK